MAAQGFTQQVIHPLVGSLVAGVAGAKPSATPPTTGGKKGGKFKKLTPEQASAFLGFNTIDLVKYVPRPPNPMDQALAWSAIVHEHLSPEGAATRVSDAYFSLREIYSAANPTDPECGGMPPAMAIINVPAEGFAFIASVVRGQRAGVTGPMKNLHPRLKQAAAGKNHRTGFACAEMHALNGLLFALEEEHHVLKGAEARIFGTPDGEDAGRDGGKKYMPPCQDAASGVGCHTVLTALGVQFLKSG